MGDIAEVRECYYGEATVQDGKTYLLCLLGPVHLGPSRPPKYRLIIDVALPVEGTVVVSTIRYTRLWKNGSCSRYGAPVKAVDISYDPDPNPPGVWRGRMRGEWPVRRVPIRRRSRWERIRR